MDNKYQIIKSKEPETKQEIIQHQIEQLVKQRDKETNSAAKKALQTEIMKLFAQYSSSKKKPAKVFTLTDFFSSAKLID